MYQEKVLHFWSKNLKRYVLYLLVIIFLAIPLFASNIFGQISHQISFSLADISFDKKEGGNQVMYDVIRLSNTHWMDDIGKPLLPVRYVNLIIPPETDVKSIDITTKIDNELEGQYYVFPTQPPIPTSGDANQTDFVAPDSTIYNSNNPYPPELIKVVHTGYFDGSNRIVQLAIYPLQYIPKARKLIFHSQFNFTIKLTPSEEKAMRVFSRRSIDQKVYDSALRSLVDNPQDIPVYTVPPFSMDESIGLTKTATISYYPYVIITSSALASNFDEFIKWKKRKGVPVGVVTTNEIYVNYSGDLISGINDNAGRIRHYLYDAWQQGTVWALLAGDHTIVPVRYGIGTSHWYAGIDTAYIIPADIYYSEFQGDWNVDGDSHYGESYGDSPQYYPEIFVGRLPCEANGQEILNWIEKVLKYEQNPGNGSYNYLTPIFTIALSVKN